MLLNDFITVALIPALIQPNSSETQFTNLRNENSRALQNSRRLPLPQSSEESDIFGNDAFFTGYNEPSSPAPRQPIVRDPILRAIYEEEKRLNLQSDDDFDDMRSEEARELINFQRRKVTTIQNLAKQAGAVVGIPQGRALFFEPRNTNTQRGFNSEDRVSSSLTTAYPILMPVAATVPEKEGTSDSENPSSTTVRPSVVGRLGIGGVFNKVTTGVGNVFGNLHNKFRGSSNTTPAPTSPPHNSVYFPDDIRDKASLPTQQPNHDTHTGANPIIFNDKDEISPGPLNCTGAKTEYDGKCYNVLQQLPCSTGQWLIEDDTTGKGKCVENKCASDPNLAYFGGKCVLVRAEGDHCHKGMVTYIFKNGEVECDCKNEYLFNQRDGNCYPAYRRGPCNSGEMFVTKVTERGARPASCMKNKCSKDGFFCNAPSCPNDRNCVELKSKCDTGVWDIHPQTLTPKCIDFDVHKPDKIIGNVPTLACAPGSRRDILGTCRKPSKISFS